MRFVLSLISAGLLTLTLSSCSNNSSSGGGGGGGGTVPKTEFEKLSGGTWVSNCSADNDGTSSTDTMILGANGKGTTQITKYNNLNCTGTGTNQGTIEFTYTIANLKDGRADFTLDYPGKPRISGKLQIQGDLMFITAPQGTTTYKRVGGNPNQDPATDPNKNPDQGGGNGGGNGDFDSFAVGTWVSECFPMGGQSRVVVLQFSAGQKAKGINNDYNTNDCRGTPTPGTPQDVNFTVDRFANGAGQITVEGSIYEVIFQGREMTLNFEGGSVRYTKIR